MNLKQNFIFNETLLLLITIGPVEQVPVFPDGKKDGAAGDEQNHCDDAYNKEGQMAFTFQDKKMICA